MEPRQICLTRRVDVSNVCSKYGPRRAVCQERIASGVSQPWPSRASRAAFDEQLGEATYAVTCRGVADTRNDLVVRQGTETFPAYPFIAGPIAVIPYVPGVYWDLTPTPRVGQWLAFHAPPTARSCSS
jgi:hypothetical protein